jgi:hypothetical protein
LISLYWDTAAEAGYEMTPDIELFGTEVLPAPRADQASGAVSRSRVSATAD